MELDGAFQSPGNIPDMLYIVATPIGHLDDITLRAVQVLKEVDAIACEDTRQTQKLLQHFGISKKLIPFFEHQEQKRLPALMAHLKAGKSLALVTDAGTPGISDPGYRLVHQAVAEGIVVVPIPGPCALVAALSASALPTDHFLFIGFLPEKPGKRLKKIESLKDFPHTLVLYLSKWKAARQVQELLEVLGERKICLARELTKIHEEFWRGTLGELSLRLKEKQMKGEATLMIEGKHADSDSD